MYAAIKEREAISLRGMGGVEGRIPGRSWKTEREGESDEFIF